MSKPLRVTGVAAEAGIVKTRIASECGALPLHQSAWWYVCIVHVTEAYGRSNLLWQLVFDHKTTTRFTWLFKAAKLFYVSYWVRESPSVSHSVQSVEKHWNPERTL
jgi:hypothetical protein